MGRAGGSLTLSRMWWEEDAFVNNTMQKLQNLAPLQATDDPVKFCASFVLDGQKIIFFLPLKESCLQPCLKSCGIC